MPDYVISGLQVQSELDLPGAIPSDIDEPAVLIRWGTVPEFLVDTTAHGPTWEVAGRAVLLRVAKLARFLISDGRLIVVQMEPGAEKSDAAGFVLGSAFGILLHLRGALVLHGAAVARSGKSIAICGSSGAGKSTLAAALCMAGCSFLADDICVIEPNQKAQPLILPDGRQLKLWKQSVDELALGSQQRDAVRSSFEKFYIEPAISATVPTRLSAIYVLRSRYAPIPPGIERLSLPDAMRTLERQTYRPRFRATLRIAHPLHATAAVLGHAGAYLVAHGDSFSSLSETVSRILAHWDAIS